MLMFSPCGPTYDYIYFVTMNKHLHTKVLAKLTNDVQRELVVS
jgi:hypothetical protein